MFHLTSVPFIFTPLFILILMVACSSDQQIFLAQAENAIVPSSLPIEHVEIIVFESFPIHINVIAKGNLPDNCTTINQITEEQNGNTLIIKITTVRQNSKVCHQTKNTFEEVIPLNIEGLKAGIYTVKVNNIISVFELGVDNIIP
ncbi:hypothetical protein [Candidatus Parabeggiatoa sp. HSG14]|uniref:hypothetical protein n=1 Tax=Candidatus Parabeggiatoa sp. HSG14 TaxID=3055593 RepID=UPI0025A9294D|nr:hypothetical protein [Thiotrichales bacterium HSG14]